MGVVVVWVVVALFSHTLEMICVIADSDEEMAELIPIERMSICVTRNKNYMPYLALICMNTLLLVTMLCI